MKRITHITVYPFDVLHHITPYDRVLFGAISTFFPEGQKDDSRAAAKNALDW